MKVLVRKRDLSIIEGITEELTNGYEIFDTLPEAEDYVFKNKPCLSYNDLWEFLENNSSTNFVLSRKLTKLIKSKLTTV